MPSNLLDGVLPLDSVAAAIIYNGNVCICIYEKEGEKKIRCVGPISLHDHFCEMQTFVT